MKPTYRISAKAIEDIDSIWVYTCKNWSVEQADKYYKIIMDEIFYISENIDRGKEMNHVKMGYRRTWIKSHLIFYKVAKDGIVEIIRVLHQNMDVESRL